MYIYRPVKIIRLIGRDTVEEIILNRAEAKLKLTNKVIEGGQFSTVDKASLLADTNIKVYKLFQKKCSKENLNRLDTSYMDT